MLIPAAKAAGVSVEHDDHDVLLHYHSVVGDRPDYLQTAVKLEFGGRATGEPAEWAVVHADLAQFLPQHVELLPEARIRTMSASRTFWEKVTAMHVHCGQTRPAAERFARHWFDVACMQRAGQGKTALADMALARKVVDHKRYFFIPSKTHGDVDLNHCVTGQLRVVPAADQADELRRDYETMLDAGYVWGWKPSWDEVIALVAAVEAGINRCANNPTE